MYQRYKGWGQGLYAHSRHPGSPRAGGKPALGFDGAGICAGRCAADLRGGALSASRPIDSPARIQIREHAQTVVVQFDIIGASSPRQMAA